jgi:transposase InsO family protein
MAEGGLYLAVMIDSFVRLMVGWSMERIRAELVRDALRMALYRHRLDSGLILHSDRGSQYCGQAFRAVLSESARCSARGTEETQADVRVTAGRHRGC